MPNWNTGTTFTTNGWEPIFTFYARGGGKTSNMYAELHFTGKTVIFPGGIRAEVRNYAIVTTEEKQVKVPIFDESGNILQIGDMDACS